MLTYVEPFAEQDALQFIFLHDEIGQPADTDGADLIVFKGNDHFELIVKTP